MSRSYAQIQDLCEQMLQDTSNATYDTTELGYWIEESLKEFTTYVPRIVPIVFQIESRTGTDTAGTASALTDTTESQFLAADATDEKVIYNTDDHTWAVVLTNSSTSVNTLSADIMDEGDGYKMFNKRCWNNKQIFIGDIDDYLWIDSVEYPIGKKRNWKVYDEVLEIDVALVADSDTTQTDLPDVDVLVRFVKPHKLCQLGTLAGAVNLAAGYAKGIKTMALDGLGTTETIEIGDEFHLANKRYIYTITTGVTLSGGGGDVSFFPGVEDAVVNNDAITFTKSTLQPQHEELFCHLVAARAMLSDAEAIHKQSVTDLTTGRALINTIPKGGAGTSVPTAYVEYARAGVAVAGQLLGRAERKLAEVLSKLDRVSVPKTKRRYPRW